MSVTALNAIEKKDAGSRASPQIRGGENRRFSLATLIRHSTDTEKAILGKCLQWQTQKVDKQAEVECKPIILLKLIL